MKAVDLLNSCHPLHKYLVAFCKGQEPTKRQARRFLQKYPNYRN